jgi:hypothetical protein
VDGTSGEMTNVHKIFIGKSEKTKPLGRPHRMWEDYVQMDLNIGCVDVNWIQLSQDRYHWRALVITAVNLYDSQKVWNLLASLAINSV